MQSLTAVLKWLRTRVIHLDSLVVGNMYLLSIRDNLQHIVYLMNLNGSEH